jgi:hypothetical protein
MELLFDKINLIDMVQAWSKEAKFIERTKMRFSPSSLTHSRAHFTYRTSHSFRALLCLFPVELTNALLLLLFEESNFVLAQREWEGEIGVKSHTQTREREHERKRNFKAQHLVPKLLSSVIQFQMEMRDASV